ncbi:MAG: D-alanine--D-alanine ligase [Planctomycetes bacterium ADurb.Bin401]|nr:MAG: D-alanine--D-alanine ligase [Planctomycetes bacterium ADurb.Bin401]
MPIKELIMDNILILHNTFGPADDPLYQSRAAVMDQVVMVEQSCQKLGIKYSTLPVESLKHLISLLEVRREKIIFNLIEEFLDSLAQAAFVPVICQAYGKSCTGNSTPTSVLAQNKVQAEGLECPAGAVFHNGKYKANLLKKGKYIIKPAFCDGSEGITADSVVQLPAETERAKALVAQLYRQFVYPVIVERFIGSRELNISLMERNGKVDVLPIAEIDFSAFSDNQPNIVDYSAKWEKDSFVYNNTPRKIPADLGEDLYSRIEKLSIAAWHAVGCRDYGRVEFRLDEDEKPYIIEVNPNPDISIEAGFAAALEAAGIPYEMFIFAILDNANERLKGFSNADKYSKSSRR